MKNPLLIVLLGGLWVIGQIATSVFQQLIDDGTFRFLKKGFRGALSGISYWLGAENIAMGQWIAGALFLVLGTGFIYWALFRPDKPLSCAFCGKDQNQVKKLIPGPGVLICDDCIDRVHTVLAATHKTASTPIATIQYVNDDNREVRCSFCRKHRYQVDAMAAAVRLEAGVKRGAGLAGREARICKRCLAGCDYLSLRLERKHERTGVTHGSRATEE